MKGNEALIHATETASEHIYLYLAAAGGPVCQQPAHLLANVQKRSGLILFFCPQPSTTSIVWYQTLAFVSPLQESLFITLQRSKFYLMQ